MSKTENKESISGDTKKLLLRLKTVEAQLKQSIPKKEHEEVVSTLQSNIERLTSELERTKAELERISDFNEKIKVLYDTINNQSKTLALYGKSIESLTKKINDGTVPMNIHQQALAKQREYEEKVSQMVPKEDFVSLQKRHEETLERINTMVPKSEYEALQARISELEGKIAGMVPKEELYASEQKVRQLETKLASYVPRSDYEELAAKIVALAEEATSSSFDESSEETKENPTYQESVETTQQQEVIQTPESISTLPAPQPQSLEVPAEQVQPVASVVVESASPVQPTTITPNQEEIQNEEQQRWFRFESTDIYARTPIEFIEDLEKVPVEVIQSHFERGDFERWFREFVADETSAESIRAIKEQNLSGEQLRTRILEVISQKYKQSTT
ncbi:MAG: hypothetical protein QXV32_00625 [Conexivisphaerales archaeon]